MPKSKVKRCVRPQCMEIYPESEKNKYCMCGALLQLVEIEVTPKTNKPKKNSDTKSVKSRSDDKNKDRQVKGNGEKKKERPTPKPEKDESSEESNEILNVITETKLSNPDNDVSQNNASLYLLLDDDEVKFEISDMVKIGRSTEEIKVDVDLAAYAGKDVSREHAVIKKEQDGYYITNVSKNHSVRIIDQNDNETALEYGKKVRLRSEDGILLSKKVLLQFVEED